MEEENSEAMMYLGQMFDEGLGVEKDAYKAYHWYKRAANKGDVDGIYNTGLCYLNGDGV